MSRLRGAGALKPSFESKYGMAAQKILSDRTSKGNLRKSNNKLRQQVEILKALVQQGRVPDEG